MSTVSELFNSDSIHKSFTIVNDNGTSIADITNTQLYSEQFILEEILDDNDTLKFGCCNPAKIKFRVTKDTEVGSVLTVSILPDGAESSYQLGIYKVYSITPNSDRSYKDVVAYDYLYDVINTDYADWYNALTFPMTIAEFRAAFFTEVGITENSATLVNDSIEIEQTISPDKLSGKEILEAICQINGCYGHIDRSGNFEYIVLDDTATASEPVLIKGSYEDISVSTITGLKLCEQDDNDGVVVGTTTNLYTMKNNFLVYGMTTDELTTVATNTLSAIINATYTPCELTIKGNPTYELGSRIEATMTDGTIVDTFLLNRYMSGIQALTDSFDVKGEETFTDNVNDTSESIKSVIEKTTVLSETVDEFYIDYESAKEQISNLIINGTGLYQITEELDDGSTVYYMADAETLSAATVIWKYTSEGLVVSNDNGSTWAVDSNGNALFTVITTHGLNADWINTGTLSTDHIDMKGSATLGGFNLGVLDNFTADTDNDADSTVSFDEATNTWTIHGSAYSGHPNCDTMTEPTLHRVLHILPLNTDGASDYITIKMKNGSYDESSSLQDYFSIYFITLLETNNYSVVDGSIDNVLVQNEESWSERFYIPRITGSSTESKCGYVAILFDATNFDLVLTDFAIFGADHTYLAYNTDAIASKDNSAYFGWDGFSLNNLDNGVSITSDGITMGTDLTIYGVDSSDNKYGMFTPLDSSGNTLIGYDHYANASGNTTIYGNDVRIAVANVDTPQAFRPYFSKGDVISGSWHTAGNCTGSGLSIYFTLPLCKPIVGNPTLTASMTFILRQNGTYTHGSGSTTQVTPSSISATATDCGLKISATFSRATNATNNDAIGIYCSGTITLS